jgi:hypothetical protein
LKKKIKTSRENSVRKEEIEHTKDKTNYYVEFLRKWEGMELK